MRNDGRHLRFAADFPLRDAFVTAKSTVPNCSEKVAQKAAQYTAATGRIEGNEVESPSYANLLHAPENKEHEGSKRQEVALLRKLPKLPNRMERDSNPRYVSARRFSRPVP